MPSRTPKYPPRLGIVGGGQLGKMLCQAAQRMGIPVTVIDPTPSCPAAHVCNKLIVADFSDKTAIAGLVRDCDIVTYEIELAGVSGLEELGRSGIIVSPSPAALHILQNKLRQKQFLREHGIPVPDFAEVKDQKEFMETLARFGHHAMLKISQGSYDGRGNIPVTEKSNLREVWKRVQGKQVFLETWVDFEKELSILIARNARGEMIAYPVAENSHVHSILDTSIVPARVSPAVQERVRQIALDAIAQLPGSGIFCVECFLVQGQVLVNEIAPRVHNSGHYTIEACDTSQFEQHLRAIMGLPFGSARLLSPVVMCNILGTGKRGKPVIRGMEKTLAIPRVSVHVYGKPLSRPGRKMGHFTVLDETVEAALKKSLHVKEMILIEGM